MFLSVYEKRHLDAGGSLYQVRYREFDAHRHRFVWHSNLFFYEYPTTARLVARRYLQLGAQKAIVVEWKCDEYGRTVRDVYENIEQIPRLFYFE